MLESFLSLFTRGACKTVGGQVVRAAAPADAAKGYVRGSIKSLIRVCGVETILLYIAVLLKKRVVVIGENADDLLEYMRTVPQLVYARKNWDILRPHNGATPLELEALAAETVPYVAGFTDRQVAAREDLYDVLVDIPGRTVKVASHATDTFGLGKVHKEIAMYMLSAAEDEEVADLAVVKELVSRTTVLIDGLKSLGQPSPDDPEHITVTLEAIRSRKMPAAMHSFLHNLGLAEGLVTAE